MFGTQEVHNRTACCARAPSSWLTLWRSRVPSIPLRLQQLLQLRGQLQHLPAGLLSQQLRQQWAEVGGEGGHKGILGQAQYILLTCRQQQQEPAARSVLSHDKESGNQQLIPQNTTEATQAAFAPIPLLHCSSIFQI